VDIGARIRQGQLLAEIETPELDQQLRQAKADLQNALANLQIAQITARRWQNLLKWAPFSAIRPFVFPRKWEYRFERHIQSCESLRARRNVTFGGAGRAGIGIR
jgi:hypothetical protein